MNRLTDFSGLVGVLFRTTGYEKAQRYLLICRQSLSADDVSALVIRAGWCVTVIHGAEHMMLADPAG